jgi:hypothetical protein
MIKKLGVILVFMVFSILWLAAPAQAQRRGFGLGVILGEPTGLSLKSWTGRTTAIDAAAAWSFGREDSLHFHVDYLVHDFNLLKTSKGRLPVYYGIGGRIKLEDKTRIGVRFPVGVSYIFEDAPLDLFAELGPILDLAPRTEFTLSASIGLRYYF